MKIRPLLPLASVLCLACSSRSAPRLDAALEDAAPEAATSGARLDGSPSPDLPPPVDGDARGDVAEPGCGSPGGCAARFVRPRGGPGRRDRGRALLHRRRQAHGHARRTDRPAGVRAHRPRLHLRLDPVGKTFTIGSDGSASRAPMSTADGETFVATAPLKVFIPARVPLVAARR
jgi:hypothetical protein